MEPGSSTTMAATAPASTGPRLLAGRHAVVTGASRGIGAAIALELARLGADLTVIGRRRPALAEIVLKLKGAGAGKVADIAADVTDERAISRALDEATAGLGAPSILVNNAGGAESAPFARTDPALWRRMIDLNLTSVYLCARALAPAMVASGYGRIVNIASTAGLKGYPFVSAYTAAKHGVVGLTRALALELAKTGVTVNAVCPGYTETAMIDAAVAGIAAKTGRRPEDVRAGLAAANPMGRMIRPQEVAGVVGWLCLPSAAALTGQAIPVEGGELA